MDSSKQKDVVSLETLDENSNNDDHSIRSQSPNNYFEETLADNDLSSFMDNGHFRYASTSNHNNSFLNNVVPRRSTASVASSSISSSVAATKRLSGGIFMTNQTPSIFSFDNTNINNQEDLMIGDDLSLASNNKSCCTECGMYAYLVKCAAHCDKQLCENCCDKHWQLEINELIKIKTTLENSVADLRKYLGAKKSQCQENIKNSQQIKKFINMTLQQIKRKVELELENKRDELFHSVDTFVDNQKKISHSINEDTFQTSEKICNEIENLLLMSESDNINVLKMKSLKTFAKSCTQKLVQQKQGRIPLYSIFFVPDSTVQVNNSFGKIVLKSYDSDQEYNMSEFNDTASYMNGIDDDLNIDPTLSIYNNNTNEYSYLFNDNNNFDSSQFNSNNRYNLNNRNSYTANYQNKYNNGGSISSNINNNEYNLNHRRSSSQQIGNHRYNNTSNYNNNIRNFSPTKLVPTRPTSYLEDRSIKNLNEDLMLKSVSNGKLVAEEEEINTDNENTTVESQLDDDDIGTVKPFVPGKILMAQQQQQSVRSLSSSSSSSLNQTTNPTSSSSSSSTNSSNPQIKEIKVYHKNQSNRLSLNEATIASTNSSKENTPTPSLPSNANNNNLQKSFNQQIVNPGPKLVNF